MPRNVDPLRTNLHNTRHEPRRPATDASGQPDPMRTSIDIMADRGRGGRNGGGRGPGGGQNRSGGGGFGSRGSGNPSRSFSR
jgi:ATP-dependent RNA helicase RhlE